MAKDILSNSIFIYIFKNITIHEYIINALYYYFEY